MPPRIKAIDIRAFRGVRELGIPLEGRSLIVQGENGTGKSSIAEALEFFFTGEVAHLQGTQGISLERHAPHVHFGPDDVLVNLAFDPGDTSLDRTLTTAPVPPRELQPYFATASNGSFMLRRSQLLAFVNSQPAERFNALASIIGIEDLERIELEMMHARDELEGQLEYERSRVQGLLQGLSADFAVDISSLSEVLPALNQVLEASRLPPLRQIEEIDGHAEKMLAAIKSSSGVDASASLGHSLALARIQALPETFLEDIASFNHRSNALHEERATAAVRLMGILATSSQLIEEQTLEECPVCQTPIVRNDLLPELARRMAALQALTTEASDVRSSAARIRSGLEGFKGQVQNVRSALPQDSAESVPSLSSLEKAPLFVEGLTTLVRSAQLDVPLPLPELPDQVQHSLALWAALPSEIESLISRLGVTEEEKALLATVRLLASMKEKLAHLEDAARRESHLDPMHATSLTICNTFSSAKRTKVSEIYGRIQQDVDRFYAALHPGEPHHDFALRLATGRRASAQLRIRSFGGGSEDPRALCSEGHLDSLGLCIFLAFVQEFSSDCSLVVLDDVITAIDASHRRRVCDLLFTEMADRQLVITTHDPIWFRELLAAQRSFRLEARFMNLQITHWSVDSGPVIASFSPRPDAIQARLEAGQKDIAGNDSRQYLEWLLKLISVNTNAPVPVTDWQTPTVGNLLPPARQRVLSLVDDEEFTTRLGDAFSTLERTAIFGNLLSHDNILADQVSLAEVQEFFAAIAAIHRLVACSECGSPLTYVRETHEFRCNARRCQSPTIFRTR